MIKIKNLFLTLFFSCFFALTAFCQLDEDAALVMYSGETRVLPVHNPTRISITKPDIADITEASEKEVRVVAKAQGETTILWSDKLGEHSFDIKVYSENMNKIKERIEMLAKELNISGITIRPINNEGKVFMFGDLKKEDKDRFFSVLGAYMAKITDFINVKEEELLVEITAEVLDLTKTASRELGFSFPREFDAAETFTSVPTTSFKDLFFKMGPVARTNSYGWALKLLEDRGEAKVLSRPRVICQSGKTAELMVGGEVPLFSTQVAAIGSSGTQIEYKEYGVKLSISPTVSKEGKILLSLNINISDFGAAESIGGSGGTTAKAYPVTKRTISTQLYINDNETMAIGGLIKQKTSEALSKFPWLGDVPVLGAFFRHRTKPGDEDVELFITLTPRVIYSIDGKTVYYSDKEKSAPVNVKQQDSVETTAVKNMNLPEDLQGYMLTVQKKISNSITFPKDLVNSGWEGTVFIKLVINESGILEDALITKSSGYKIFDAEAVKLAKSLTYPPFPSGIKLKQLKVDIPIVYRERK